MTRNAFRGTERLANREDQLPGVGPPCPALVAGCGDRSVIRPWNRDSASGELVGCRSRSVSRISCEDVTCVGTVLSDGGRIPWGLCLVMVTAQCE